MRCTAVLVSALMISMRAWAFEVVGDGIPLPLTNQVPSAERGFAIAQHRQQGLCILCHSIPGSTDRFQGDVSTALAGAGSRYTAAQLRLRVADARRINPESTMPSFNTTQARTRVAQAWAGKPLLDAQQVEDVVAWLVTLR